MRIVYLALTAGIFLLTVWNLWSEKDWRRQASAAMVALPLLLRILLIK